MNHRRHDHGSSMSGMDMGSMGSMGSDAGMECSMDMLGNWKVRNICVLTSSWHIKTTAQFVGTCIGVFLLVFLIEAIRRWGREWDRFIVRRAVQERLALRLARREALLSREQRQHANAIPTAPGKGGLADETGSQSESLASASASSSLSPSRRRGATAAASQSTHPAPLSQNRTLARIESAFFGVPASSSAQAAALNRARFRPTVLQQLVRSFVYAVQFAGAYIVMLIAMTFNGYILIAIVLGGFAGHFVSTWDNLSRTVLDGGSDHDDDDTLTHDDNVRGIGGVGVGAGVGAGATAAVRPLRESDPFLVDEKAALTAEQRAVRLSGAAHDDSAYGSGACCG